MGTQCKLFSWLLVVLILCVPGLLAQSHFSRSFTKPSSSPTNPVAPMSDPQRRSRSSQSQKLEKSDNYLQSASPPPSRNFLPKLLQTTTAITTATTPGAVLPPKSVPLVAGCGRSGTFSTRTFLKKAGIDTVHENVLPGNVTVSWLHTPANFDTTNFPGFGGRKDVRRKLESQLRDQGLPLFDPVVHVVRHPLRVISSTRRCFCGGGDRYAGEAHRFHVLSWKFVDDILEMPPEAQDYDSVLRSMVYWYQWNKNVPLWHEGRVTERFRVEDINPRRLLEALKVPLTEELDQRVSEYLGKDQDHMPNDPQHKSRNSAKADFPDLDWWDLWEADANLTRLIWNQAQEYGYEVDRTLEQALEENLLSRAKGRSEPSF